MGRTRHIRSVDLFFLIFLFVFIIVLSLSNQESHAEVKHLFFRRASRSTQTAAHKTEVTAGTMKRNKDKMTSQFKCLSHKSSENPGQLAH